MTIPPPQFGPIQSCINAEGAWAAEAQKYSKDRVDFLTLLRQYSCYNEPELTHPIDALYSNEYAVIQAEGEISRARMTYTQNLVAILQREKDYDQSHRASVKASVKKVHSAQNAVNSSARSLEFGSQRRDFAAKKPYLERDLEEKKQQLTFAQDYLTNTVMPAALAAYDELQSFKKTTARDAIIALCNVYVKSAPVMADLMAKRDDLVKSFPVHATTAINGFPAHANKLLGGNHLAHCNRKLEELIRHQTKVAGKEYESARCMVLWGKTEDDDLGQVLDAYAEMIAKVGLQHNKVLAAEQGYLMAMQQMHGWIMGLEKGDKMLRSQQQQVVQAQQRVQAAEGQIAQAKATASWASVQPSLEKMLADATSQLQAAALSFHNCEKYLNLGALHQMKHDVHVKHQGEVATSWLAYFTSIPELYTKAASLISALSESGKKTPEELETIRKRVAELTGSLTEAAPVSLEDVAVKPPVVTEVKAIPHEPLKKLVNRHQSMMKAHAKYLSELNDFAMVMKEYAGIETDTAESLTGLADHYLKMITIQQAQIAKEYEYEAKLSGWIENTKETSKFVGDFAAVDGGYQSACKADRKLKEKYEKEKNSAGFLQKKEAFEAELESSNETVMSWSEQRDEALEKFADRMQDYNNAKHAMLKSQWTELLEAQSDTFSKLADATNEASDMVRSTCPDAF